MKRVERFFLFELGSHETEPNPSQALTELKPSQALTRAELFSKHFPYVWAWARAWLQLGSVNAHESEQIEFDSIQYEKKFKVKLVIFHIYIFQKKKQKI